MQFRLLSLTLLCVMIKSKFLGMSLRTTFSIEELVEKLVLWTWADMIGGLRMIVNGRCEHIFGVSHDIDDLE